MAKIKITESELKQVIRESVSDVLNENPNFLNNFRDQLNTIGGYAKDNLNKIKNIAGGVKNTAGDAYGGVKNIFNAGKNAKNLKAVQAELSKVKNDYETLKTQLDNANKTATMYSNAIGAVSKALNLSEGMIKENVGIDPSVGGAPQPGVPSTQKQPVGQEGTPVGKAPELDAILGAIKKLNGTIGAQKATITDLTTQLRQSNAQLAQARNQAVRSNTPQPAVNQNQAIPAAKPIPQQTARPAAQTPGTAIAQK